MLYCTHQIRTRGTDIDDVLFTDASISTPWPELKQSRAGTWAEQKPRWNTTVLSDGRLWKDVWDHPSYPFRIFKSHYAPGVLPIRKKGGSKIKYLAMVRNGLDMAASFTTFYSAHTPEFRRLWGGERALVICVALFACIEIDGLQILCFIFLHRFFFLMHDIMYNSLCKGFPPVIPDEAVSADEPPPAVKDILPGGVLSEMYWGYIREWWAHRSDPNVLLLHYTNVRQNPRLYIEKIAKFLEVELTVEELDTVQQRCSIEHMRNVDLFGYKLPLNKDGKGLWDIDNHYLMARGSMTKEGRLGTGEFYLTVFLYSLRIHYLWCKQ